MAEEKKEGPKYFYLVSLQINLLTGGTAHSMRGLGTVKPITYQDLVDAARRDHSSNVDNVIILYKESMTKEEYKHFWTEREEEKEAEQE